MDFTFDQTQFVAAKMTGHRFALKLNQAGQKCAAFQALFEDVTEHQAVHGAGRGKPGSLMAGAGTMPAIGAKGNLAVKYGGYSLSLDGFELKRVDRRVAGEIAITLIHFESMVGLAAPTCQAAANLPAVGGYSSGQMRFDAGTFKPLREIDCSGKVLGWRTDRSAVQEPIAWMMARGANWDFEIDYNWHGDEGTQKITIPSANIQAMLYEELGGRFLKRVPFGSTQLEAMVVLGGSDVSAQFLLCDLDDVITRSTGNVGPLAPVDPGYARVEERVAIVSTHSVNKPVF